MAGRQHEKDPVAWKFPVHCFKASLLNVDPLRDMLITRRQESQDIRNATQNFHSRVKEIQPRLSIQHVCLFNGVQTDASEERWMNSHQGAPHGGGVDHEKLLETRGQAMKQNSELVKRSLERRQGAKAARHSFMESRREKVVWQRERDRARMEASMTQRRVSLDREMEDTRRRHVAFLEEKKRAASEREMAMEFSWRHASVTKAVNKYSTQLRAFTLHREKSQSVARSKVPPPTTTATDETCPGRQVALTIHATLNGQIGVCIRGYHAGQQ
ncbi:unnamed protein product [Merluccius merluccius]